MPDPEGLQYLCCPYSHPVAGVRMARFGFANRVAAMLMRRGVPVLSPVSHSHPIALEGGLPTGWDFWERYDRALLGACAGVLVLTVEGWRESVGVRAELAIAREMGLPVRRVDEAGTIGEWE